MKKKYALFIVCWFTFSTAIGQLKNLILTREQNNKWMDSVKALPFNQQLLNINYRLLADTNVYVRPFYNDRIKSSYAIADSLGNRKYGYGKPIIMINGSPMFVGNKTKTTKVIGLAFLLTNTYIKRIDFLNGNDPGTVAIYGPEGLSGIINLTLTKKKYFKKFAQLKLRPNY